MSHPAPIDNVMRSLYNSQYQTTQQRLRIPPNCVEIYRQDEYNNPTDEIDDAVIIFYNPNTKQILRFDEDKNKNDPSFCIVIGNANFIEDAQQYILHHNII